MSKQVFIITGLCIAGYYYLSQPEQYVSPHTPLIEDDVPHYQMCDKTKPQSTPNTAFDWNFFSQNGWGFNFVKHKSTGLVWNHCSSGTLGSTSRECKPGDKSAMTYFFADRDQDLTPSLNMAPSRLPTVTELLSIVEKKCSLPAINLSVFPDTPATTYWAKQEKDGAYWAVDFTNGKARKAKPDEKHMVRYIREPKTDYIVNP